MKNKALIKKCKSRGAAILELALVAPLLFLFILGIFDLGRYLAARGVLMKAAQDILNTAQKLDGIERDTSDSAELATYTALLSDPNNPSSIESRIRSMLGGLFVWPGLAEFEIEPLGGGSIKPVHFIFLRPGERGRTPLGSSQWLDHPSFPPSSLPNNYSLPQMLRQEPLYLELRTTVDFALLSYFGSSADVRAMAYGYREFATQPNRMPVAGIPTPSIPSSSTIPTPIPTPPPPTALPPPTSPPVPTSTNTPAGPTATPTNTPFGATPTPSPIPTNTPYPTDTPYPANTPLPTTTSTQTPYPTDTPLAPFSTDTPTPVPTPTDTPMPTSTNTPLPTASDTPAPTDTPIPTSTHTPFPTPTNTPAPTATSTSSPTDTPLPTPTTGTHSSSCGTFVDGCNNASPLVMPECGYSSATITCNDGYHCESYASGVTTCTAPGGSTDCPIAGTRCVPD